MKLKNLEQGNCGCLGTQHLPFSASPRQVYCEKILFPRCGLFVSVRAILEHLSFKGKNAQNSAAQKCHGDTEKAQRKNYQLLISKLLIVSAHRSPSIAAETIPPAKPAPSPHGNKLVICG